ncbi:MAG: hypothetical protein ACRDK9_14955 [Solirubrobacterales bacterium]
MELTARERGSLPGAEIVLSGIADVEAGRDSADSNAVLMASRRLRAAGIEVPPPDESSPLPSHRLYALLAAEDAAAAHSRYNAIVRRLVSFARAVEHGRGG